MKALFLNYVGRWFTTFVLWDMLFIMHFRIMYDIRTAYMYIFLWQARKYYVDIYIILKALKSSKQTRLERFLKHQVLIFMGPGREGAR